jgi:hypothetical protein
MYWRSSNSGSSERRNSQPNHDRNTKKKRRNIVIAPFAHGLSPNPSPINVKATPRLPLSATTEMPEPFNLAPK